MVARKAVINGSLVENVIVANDEFTIPNRELVTVPNDQMVCAGWSYVGGEFSEPPFVAPDPADYPLLPWQFKAMVIYLDVDADIQTAIGQIPDAMQRAWAMSRYLNATYYHFDDALLQLMRDAISMSVEDLTAAWMQAKNLTSAS